MLPNGNIVSGSYDGAIRIWDLNDIEQAFKEMSSEQAKLVWKQLKENNASSSWANIEKVLKIN